MSSTNEWVKRLDKRYSQAEGMLAYKFKLELDPAIDMFLADNSKRSFLIGRFDLAKEPWRLAAANDYRKYQLKVVTVVCAKPNDHLMDIHLIRQKP